MFFSPATTEMRGAFAVNLKSTSLCFVLSSLSSPKARTLLYLSALDPATPETPEFKKEQGQTWQFPTNIQLQIPPSMEEVRMSHRNPSGSTGPAVTSITKTFADEVSAIVLDPGYSTTRAGFAGEDVPKSVVPTYYAAYTAAGGERELLFGENSVHNPLPKVEIHNPLAGEGAEEWVSDWETATKLWEYSITSRLISPRQSHPLKNGLNDATNGGGDVDMNGTEETERPLAENPLLMSEPGISSQKSREKLTEIAFEDWGAPAFWLGRSGALAA